MESLEARLTPATSLFVITQDPTPGQPGMTATLKEYTPTGALVRSIAVTPPSVAGEQAHDLVITGDRARVYNGTTDAVLSSYSVTTGIWTTQGLAGTNTAAVGSGGVALFGTSAFLTDMPIPGSDSTQGIVWLDPAAPAERFATDTAPFDLVAGLDGRLYSLDATRVVRAYDPVVPFPQLAIVTLPAQVNVPGIGLVDMDYRAIAVDAAGRLFAVDWNAYVVRFDATGTPEAAGRLSVTNLIDVDFVGTTGNTLVTGSTDGVVTQVHADTLVATQSFAAGTGPVFVTTAPAFIEANISGPMAGVAEGNSDLTPVDFTVTLSAPSAEPVLVNWATVAGTATAGTDFEAGSGTLTFAAGETTKTITIKVVGETTFELDESFAVTLSAPAGAVIATGSATATITNDDPVPTLSVADFSIVEGTGGTFPRYRFNILLSNRSYQPVSFRYTMADGTATAGVDYGQFSSNTLTIPPGSGGFFLEGPIAPDSMYEPDETFTLTLSEVVGANLGQAVGTGTIVNDDPIPTMTVDSASVTEGNSGTRTLTFNVRLSNTSSLPVSVNYATGDGTATAGSDYTAAAGTVTFAPGVTVQPVTVTVSGDTLFEANETLTLNLSSLVNANLGTPSTGTGTIVNDDALPVVLVNAPSVAEGNTGTTDLTFAVSLSAPSGVSTSVNFATSDGTAVAGSDYTAASGTLTFAPGETTKLVPISVLADGTVEPNETVRLTATTLGSLSTGQGTLLNDDAAPVANAGPDLAVNEGANVTFDGSSSFDPNGDPLTYLWDFGDGGTGTGASPTHAYRDNGTYQVTLTVDDGYGNTSTDTAVVTVLNVAPTAGIDGPSSGVRGQTRTFVLNAADPSPDDQLAPFGYRVQWGDGTTSTVSGPGSGTPVTHTYASAGTFTIRAWATDKDGSQGVEASRVFTSKIVEVQGTDLLIGGTSGVETILLTATTTPDTVAAKVNNVPLGTFTAPGQIVVFAQGGDDKVSFATVKVRGQTYFVKQELLLLGGDGKDTLDARNATGPAVLVGGAGNDTIFGGSGRTILIGGAGADTLRGGSADDILIGSLTIHDTDPTGLAALRSEWARTNASYAIRRDHLLGSPGGSNGTYTLAPPAVTDDGGVMDVLVGNEGRDWFFRGPNDRLDDRKWDETITEL